MPFPSLSEMMQAIQDSQQNAFIPAYQQAQQQKLEQDYKKQQMEKIMQEMRLTEDMHPLEMDSKRGATRLNNSSADINELSASTTRTTQSRPAYLSSVDANQNKLIAEADSAIHKSTQDNLKSQIDMEQAAREMAFFNKPGSDSAASTSAAAWQNREQQRAQLKAASIRANAAASAGAGGDGLPKNATQYLAQVTKAFRDTSDAFKQYKQSKGITTKAQFDADPVAQQLYELALRAKQDYEVATTTTKTTSAPYEGLPPIVNTTVKGAASGNWSSTPNGNGKYFVDEQGRIHLD